MTAGTEVARSFPQMPTFARSIGMVGFSSSGRGPHDNGSQKGRALMGFAYDHGINFQRSLLPTVRIAV